MLGKLDKKEYSINWLGQGVSNFKSIYLGE